MNVFIIEDSSTISLILERTLSSYGYIPLCYTSSTFSPDLLKDHCHDIFIVDTSIQNLGKTNICKIIRLSNPSSYIIGITHKGTWQDKIEFLNNGADDCMSFPFPPEEILARIQALLRRPKTQVDVSLKYGKFELDTNNRKAFYDNNLLKLSGKEYKILEYFIRNYGRSISRSELMDHVWDYRKPVASNTVDVHITKLRKKITSTKNVCYDNSNNFESEIKTVYGVGYKINENFPENIGASLSSSA